MRFNRLLAVIWFLVFFPQVNSQVTIPTDSVQKRYPSPRDKIHDTAKTANYSSANESKSLSNNKTELWISLGAAVISIFALILSFWQFKKAEARAKREELQDIVEKLIDSRREYNNKLLGNMAESERITFGDYYGKIFMIYLQVADQLISSLDKTIVSPMEYFIIGSEFESEGDLSRAKKYYEYARKVLTATSVKSQETILRALGAFYFRDGPYRDIQLGRSYHEEAIELFSGQSDEYLIFLKAFVYRAWAEQERYATNIEDAIQKIFLAYETISSLSDEYSGKISELRNVFNFWIDTIMFYSPQSIAKPSTLETPGNMKKMLFDAMNFYSQLPEEDNERNRRIEDVRWIANTYKIAL